MADAQAIRVPIEMHEPASGRPAGTPGLERFAIPVAVPRKPRCPHNAEDEIVVCAQNQEQFRMRPLPENFAQKETPAEISLGEGVTLKAEVEGAAVGGVPSNRAMVRLKFRF